MLITGIREVAIANPQNCCHFWTGVAFSRLTSVNNHGDRRGCRLEMQNHRQFLDLCWVLASQKFQQSKGVTGIGRVVVAKRKSVVTFGLVEASRHKRQQSPGSGGRGCEGQNFRHFWIVVVFFSSDFYTGTTPSSRASSPPKSTAGLRFRTRRRLSLMGGLAGGWPSPGRCGGHPPTLQPKAAWRHRTHPPYPRGAPTMTRPRLAGLPQPAFPPSGGLPPDALSLRVAQEPRGPPKPQN